MDEDVAGYVDLVRIGEGAAGVVYRARQDEFARDVAIKVLSGTFDDASWWRFERECRSVGALSGHPGVITVYEAGRARTGQPFIAMEYCALGSLEDLLLREGCMPWRSVVAIGVRLAAALEAVHRAGVLHRDIKPANVLVSEFDEPKLADFGVAHVREGARTETGALAMTAAYAAPELLEEGEATVATDVYALCALLSTLLVGHPPFGSLSDQSIGRLVRRIMDEPFPGIDRSLAPEQLALVLKLGLAKAPGDRPGSAGQLARQLQAVQASLGEPLTPASLPADGSEPRTVDGARRLRPRHRARRARTLLLRRSRSGVDARSPRSRLVRWLSLALAGALLACVALLIGLRANRDDHARSVNAAPVSFFDQFDRPASGWGTGRDMNSAETGYDNGLYWFHVVDTNGIGSQSGTAKSRVAISDAPLSGRIGTRLQSLGTTTVEAVALVTESNPLVGVMCRHSRSGGPYYYGVVDGNGYWGIYKFTGTKHRTLAANPTAVLATEGQFVKVRFDCVNQKDGSVTLALSSGGTVIGTARDADHPIPSGAPGLVVRTRKGTSSAEFDNFRVSGRAQVPTS